MKTTKLSLMLLCAAAGTAAADKAEAPKMPPKPAELDAAYKGMIGDWKCEGKGNMGGTAFKYTGSMKAAWELDGYWVVSRSEGVSAGMPAYKSMDTYGYDSAQKALVCTTVDNMGTWGWATSKGWQGDKMEWAGKNMAMGKETDVKWTVTRKGDKEITLAGGAAGSTWEQTCKR